MYRTDLIFYHSNYDLKCINYVAVLTSSTNRGLDEFNIFILISIMLGIFPSSFMCINVWFDIVLVFVHGIISLKRYARPVLLQFQSLLLSLRPM